MQELFAYCAEIKATTLANSETIEFLKSRSLTLDWILLIGKKQFQEFQGRTIRGSRYTKAPLERETLCSQSLFVSSSTKVGSNIVETLNHSEQILFMSFLSFHKTLLLAG